MASTRVVKVGVTENAPWIHRDSAGLARGPEAELVARFAAQHGASVQWIWGQQEELFAALEHFQLALVVGGIDEDTPWSKRIGLTRAWHERKLDRAPPGVSGKLVMAVPPGENRWLSSLERFLAREQDTFQQRGEEAER